MTRLSVLRTLPPVSLPPPAGDGAEGGWGCAAGARERKIKNALIRRCAPPSPACGRRGISMKGHFSIFEESFLDLRRIISRSPKDRFSIFEESFLDLRRIVSRPSLPPPAGEGAEGGWGCAAGARGCKIKSTLIRRCAPPSPACGRRGISMKDHFSIFEESFLDFRRAVSQSSKGRFSTFPSPACGGRCRRRMGVRRRRARTQDQKRPHPALRTTFSRKHEKGLPLTPRIDIPRMTTQ